MRKLIAWLRGLNWKLTLGYCALFFVLFFVFLYLTFPYNSVRDAIVRQVESLQGAEGTSAMRMRVEVADVSPFRLTGVRLQGVKLSRPEDPRQVLLNLNEVRIRLRPTQLLRGRLWLDFDVYAYDGGAAGSYCKRGPVTDLALNFVGLRLAKYGTRELVQKFGSMSLDGTLSGQFELHFNPAMRRNNSGGLTLNIDKLKATGITMVGNKLPDMTFEPGKIVLKMQNQNFQVDEFKLKSDQLEVDLTGRITLADQMKNSRLFLNFRFKPSDELETALGMLMMTMKEPDDEGFYSLSINGTPGNLRTRH